MTAGDDRLRWVQALRGIAVLLVVLTHARYLLRGTGEFALAHRLLYPGAMGVDLFFVISGFIMVYTTTGASGRRAAALFAVRRFTRIWPAYAVVTLAYVLLRDGIAYFGDAGHLAALARSLLFLPVDPNDPPFFGMAFPLGWTLAFEAYFYLVFGLCMLTGRLRWFAFAAWMLLTLVLLPMGHGGPTTDARHQLDFDSAWLRLATNPIVYEFVAGVAIGHLSRCDWFRVRSARLAWLLAVAGVAWVLWHGAGRTDLFHGPAGWGWPLALMVLLLALASRTVTLAPPAALVWVGTISYSLYLTHFIVQVRLAHWLAGWGIDTHTWTQVAITVLCALPPAALAHRLLEVRLSGALRRLLLRGLPEKAGVVADRGI